MKFRGWFSPARFWAIVVKEFIQMRRDRMTFGMMVGVPLLQLMLFGYAINSDPRNLPTAVILADHGPQARAVVAAVKNSGYFKIMGSIQSEAEARDELNRGRLQFLITVPEGFSRSLLRGDRPALHVEADATDPIATGNAISALRNFVTASLQPELKGPLEFLHAGQAPFELRTHALYNPEGISQYNIVPGLMGIVLTMTMVVITALAITRERETGTMENLLSMPTRPLEVLLGKIVPYVLVGYIQVALILVASKYLFAVPMLGSISLILVVAFFFIIANLAVGITFSTLAENQRQAMQMAIFYFLPSILLSGFMFPFRGMPIWAQVIGEILPVTHFLRIIRGILLKGNFTADILHELWPIALFAACTLAIGVKRYRQTLD